MPFGFGKGRGSAKMIKQGRAGKRRGIVSGKIVQKLLKRNQKL